MNLMRPAIVRIKIALLLMFLSSLGISYTKSPERKEAQGGPAQVCNNPSPFPDGFDYPKPAREVERWVKDRNVSRIREHGWYLWAGLNQAAPNGSPVWRTWCTSTQAFAQESGQMTTGETYNRPLSMNAKNKANGPTEGNEPINFPDPPYYPVPSSVIEKYKDCYSAQQDQLSDGPTFQNNGDIMVAGVIYDDSAFRAIRGRNLYLSKTLNGQLPGGQNDPPKHVEPLPHESIVLKPMLWPVKGSGYTALPVWDDLPPSADEDKYIGYEIVGTKKNPKWWRAVAITPNPERGVTRKTVKYLYDVYSTDSTCLKPLGPITYENAKVAPIDSFYHFKFSKEDLDRMDPCDRALLDASAYWAYNRQFEPGDYLVLIAMHIITKEQPYWTFQSVWWHDQPDKGPYSLNRPANIPDGPWKHYLLTSTYGIPQLLGRGGRSDKLPVVYNPYIELAADHPIATNCMNCHHRASWPRAPQPGDDKTITCPYASYEAAGKHAPNALDVFDMENPIFNGLLTLDSMWAVSDRALGNPKYHHVKR
jgi:hypothetical protein